MLDEDDNEDVVQTGNDEGSMTSRAPEPTTDKIEIELPDAKPRSDDDDDYGEYGAKVQKRISKEVAKRRAAERREKDAIARAEQAERSAVGSDQRSAYSEANWLRTQEHALNGAQNQAELAYRRARETGNVDEEIRANKLLAAVAADQKALSMWKANNMQRIQPYLGDETPQQNARPDFQRQQQQPAQPRRPNLADEATRWIEDNDWFNNKSQNYDRVAATTAIALSQELEDEGFDVNDPKMYKELDKRLRQELPTRFSGSRRSPVGASSRGASSGGVPGRRVKLSQRQVDFAKQNNIPLERFAREMGDK